MVLSFYFASKLTNNLFPVITKFRIVRILGIVTDKENAAQQTQISWQFLLSAMKLWPGNRRSLLLYHGRTLRLHTHWHAGRPLDSYGTSWAWPIPGPYHGMRWWCRRARSPRRHLHLMRTPLRWHALRDSARWSNNKLWPLLRLAEHLLWVRLHHLRRRALLLLLLLHINHLQPIGYRRC